MIKKKKSNLPILIIIIILVLLLMVISAALKILQNAEQNVNDNTDNWQNNESVDINSTGTTSLNETLNNKLRTVEEVVQSYGSKYMHREKSGYVQIYISSKYDLFDENGVSKKQYFYDMIDEIVEIEKDSFYLRDESKQIEIYVKYNHTDGSYKIIINGDENYYDNIDGDIYTKIASVSSAKNSDFAIANEFIVKIIRDYTYYAGTELDSTDRIDLGNGYYSYQDGTILARLQKGKALNILFKENYQEQIGVGVYVTTPLEEVYEKYSNLAFGSVEDGYLTYKTNNAYIYLYEDEVSIYGQQYKENPYIDQYILDYCTTGDLEKLYNDFITGFTNYFEKEDYNPETQSLKLTFPTRGIEIDIKENDSKGIKIYNNYYITDTVKQLILDEKITLIDKDFIHITEQARRKSMR